MLPKKICKMILMTPPAMKWKDQQWKNIWKKTTGCSALQQYSLDFSPEKSVFDMPPTGKKLWWSYNLEFLKLSFK